MYKIPPIRNLALASTLFDPGLLALEPELNETRWPGHSGDPMKLNREFLDEYNNARREALANSYKNHLSRRSNNDKPILSARSFKNAVGISHEIFHPAGKDRGRNRFHIHNLRQWADRTGLPYSRFIRICVDFGLNGGSSWVPLPFAMLGSPKTRVALAHKLDFEIRENLHDLHRSFSVRNPDSAGQKRLPSCFGVIVPGRFDAEVREMRQTVCRGCRFAEACAKMSGKVVLTMKVPPLDREEKRRKQSANRSRRYRRRESMKDEHERVT